MEPGPGISRIVGVPRLAEPATGSTQTVSVEVVRVLGPGRFLVQYGGRSATAFSSLDLQPGEVLRAQLSEDAGGPTLRVPLERAADSLSTILQQLGVIDDALSRRILLSMVRSGLGLGTERLYKLRKLLQAYGDSERGRWSARLCSVLEDKGLDASLWEKMFEAVYGSGPDQEHGRSAGQDLSGEHSKPSPGEHERMVNELSVQLRQLFQSSAIQDGVSEQVVAQTAEADVLRLFNSRPGATAHWIVVPFTVHRGHHNTLAGRIRMRCKPPGEPKRVDLMVLDLAGERGRWVLEIINNGPAFRVALRCSNESQQRAGKAALTKFSERFKNAGIVLDNVLCAGDFDGFSSEPADDIIPDIDMKV